MSAEIEPKPSEDSAPPPVPEETPPAEEGHFVPRGALLFGVLLLAFYAIYWLSIWYLIVIERGA